LINSKIKFIKCVIAKQIVVFNKPKSEILTKIEEIGGFVKVDNTYDYLLDMKIHSLTEEKIKDLENKVKLMFTELEILKETTIESLWNLELKKLEF
jgi:DNA topoisomerase-2